jgi:UvrD-like helicase C-terminal domain
MVGESKPERFQRTRNNEEREHLRRLLLEPFVARVEVDWQTGGARSVETFYFPRRSAGGLLDVIRGARFVTSGAALGRLAEYEAGDTACIEVGGREREGRILKRTVLTPTQQDGLWDALVRNFEATPWGDVLDLLRHESLREVLDDIKRGQAAPVAVEDIVGKLAQEAANVEFERRRIRRKVVDRIALRDQPILDRFQGEIFRLPLDRQVMLFGPPGSGKTTTLIKRLAQKRTPDALTENEQRLVSEYLRDNVTGPESWAMFSPAELLKKYLGEAFNKEGVPDAGNVRTWGKERHDLARNVLNILRSNGSGRFQLEPDANPFIDPSSRGIAKLHDDFAVYIEASLLRRCNDALASLLKSSDDSAKKEALSLQNKLGRSKQVSIRDVLRLFDQAEGLQAEIERLNDQISGGLHKIVNQLLNTHRKLLDEIILALPAIRAEEDEETEEDADETAQTVVAPVNARAEALNILMSALRNWARAAAEGRRTLGGQSGRAIGLIGTRLPSNSQLAGIGADIATRSQLRTLVQAPRTFVLGVPGMYARFRRQAVRERRHFISNEATTSLVNRNGISPDEVDVLMLVMLRNMRRIVHSPDGRRLDFATQHDWLENIKSCYLMQIFVDEATDLSAVQLACTIELANPKLRSWFACGDLRQRVTANGIQDDAEIEWLNHTAGINIDIHRIDIGYRQSRRLRDLSDALAMLLDADSEMITKPPRGSEEADVWPLLVENLSGDDLAQWLGERIHEVEMAVGRLPSIAVFVDGDDLIDPLVKATHRILAGRNIPIVGCREGRVVGDTREVRIFDIQHIKGMEFEAVFFIGIDCLAERIPDLFHRFLYVGVTRAATYLGLTCEGTLPKRLEPLRSNFGAEGWAAV